MSLNPPVLDDRSFQDIVDEAKTRIAQDFPGWTDHNVSDPGVALIELFAWMTEQTLYRLNQVPDLMYVKFLEMIGVDREPAVSARTELQFTLSDTTGAVASATIPRGTEVAAMTSPDVDDPIIFTTHYDVTVRQPELIACVSEDSPGEYVDRFADLRTPDREIHLFGDVRDGLACYFGFSRSLANHIVRLDVTTQAAAVGFIPDDPPLEWEVWTGVGDDWEPIPTEDTTGGLNRAGAVTLTLPYQHWRSTIAGQQAYWVRVRLATKGRAATYEVSPDLRSLNAVTIGAQSLARNEVWMPEEKLGFSDGEPGQEFELRHRPILDPWGTRGTGDGREEVLLRSKAGPDEPGVVWESVDSFAGSGADDMVAVWDTADGRIRFGPTIRSRSGHNTQLGAVPKEGYEVWVTGYRVGGGTRGNVGPHELTMLRSTLPYVATVTNREAAAHGVDLESVDEAKVRGPLSLATGDRAVTPGDFERLTLRGAQLVARARAVPLGDAFPDKQIPGAVGVFIVPDFGAQTLHPNPADLEVSEGLRNRVKWYLDERRMLGTSVEVAPAEFVGVKPCITFDVQADAETLSVVHAIRDRLARELHPLDRGGSRGGWEFGEDLIWGALIESIAGVEGVAGVVDSALFRIAPRSQRAGHTAVSRIELRPHQLPLLSAPAIFGRKKGVWDGIHFD